MIGRDVMILTNDHNLAPDGYNGYVIGNVIIGDYAAIYPRALILKGVTIGKYAVIGAGAVVTHNVGDYEVWAGNPARFIKKTKNSVDKD
jgi:acetyltransferase-like isoleucine patch superfamily enzyme